MVLHQICVMIVFKENRVNLTLPATLELQTLELPVLLDKLSEQTSLYFKLLHQEGFSDNTTACKKFLLHIQAAVQSKLDLEKEINKESE